jgi:hypothetical protein
MIRQTGRERQGAQGVPGLADFVAPLDLLMEMLVLLEWVFDKNLVDQAVVPVVGRTEEVSGQLDLAVVQFNDLADAVVLCAHV